MIKRSLFPSYSLSALACSVSVVLALGVTNVSAVPSADAKATTELLAMPKVNSAFVGPLLPTAASSALPSNTPMGSVTSFIGPIQPASNPIASAAQSATETSTPIAAAPSSPVSAPLVSDSAMGASLLDRLQQGVQSLSGSTASKAKPLTSLSDSLAGASDAASSLISRAMSLLGTPYRYGGISALTGFDCSGFILDVFSKSLKIVLPRTAAEQARATQVIEKNELRPGDLVFFNTMRRAFSHVGIYVGEGKFVHSPRTGSTVRVDNMNNSYWSARFNGARRVPGAQNLSASDVMHNSGLQ